MFRFIARGLFVLSVVASVAWVRAQAPPLSFVEVTTAGPQPHVGIGGYALIAHDARNERVLLLSDSLVWVMDLRTDAWQPFQRLVLPPGVVEAAYDTTRGALVLWNGSVGDVYTWQDGDSTVTRVDRSFPHRTQYGHAGFLYPRTGDVHAFGGYGFWYYRNLITRYDCQAREWFLVPLAEGSPQPKERTEALAAYWSGEDALFVLGGVAGEGRAGRQEPGEDVMRPQRDLWRYDYTEARWHQVRLPAAVPPLARYYPSTEPLTASNTAAFSALDDASGLWLVAGRNGGPQGSLYGVDLRTGAFGRLGSLMSASEAPLGFVWDAPRNRLVVLRYLMAVRGGRRPVMVRATPADPTAVRAALDVPGETAHTLIVLAALGLFVAVGLAGLLSRRRHRRQEESSVVQPSAGLAEDDLAITVEAGGQVVKGDGTPLTMPETERRLLALLAAARHRGNPFVSVERIEAELFAEHPNLDYVRKMRNLALKRLAERLEAYRTYPGDPIVSRRSLEDRRRMEYALGESVRAVVQEPVANAETLAAIQPPSRLSPYVQR